MQKRRLVLVDASAIFYRAYFAIPPNLTTKAGLHTNAVFGFAMMFRKLFAGRKPDLAAVVFDTPGRTQRDVKYAGYKAQRPPMPEELVEQLPFVDELVGLHQFARVRLEGYEADDVIGTLTMRAVAAGLEVLIVSPDKDFAQLVSDDVKTFDTLRDITYDAELVRKKFGVPPSQFVDLLGLMGDVADNIPGVNGVGQKGAAKLLETYGSLEGILAAAADESSALKGKQRATLVAEREVALMSRDLARIDIAAPVPVELESLAVPLPDPEALSLFYRKLEFFSLLGTSRGQAAEKVSVRVLCDDEVEPWLAAQGELALAPVYEAPSPIFGEWRGLALCGAVGETVFVANFSLLKAYLADAARPKILHNAKELWQLCRRQGVALRGVVFDTMLASFLVEPTKLIPHRLDQVAREYASRLIRPQKDLVGAGQAVQPISALAVEDVAAWTAELAEAIFLVTPPLRARVVELDQQRHLDGHELPLYPVLGQMELDGIHVDGPELARVEAELKVRLKTHESRVHEMAGRKFNLGSTKQLADVLFGELKLPVYKRTKTGFSTDQEVLERLAVEHKIAAELVEHRKLAKLINTYTEVLQAAISPVDGRVHSTFQQTTGASGRLISTDPDLQRTPTRSIEGKRIRAAFTARPGFRMVSADWSQIELRVLAHASSDPLLVESFRDNLDVHRRTASQLFGVAPEMVSSAQRNVGKTVNFATIYGQGATALGQILHIPRKEAVRYIEGYFAAYAGVRTWLDRTIAEAHESGYVTTLLGRRRYIPELASQNDVDRQTGERMAANTPIQGSAADLCKLAMLRIARELDAGGHLAKMLLQIHDELLFEVPEEEVPTVTALVRAAMETVYPLLVPLVVDVGIGQSWAEAHG